MFSATFPDSADAGFIMHLSGSAFVLRMIFPCCSIL